MYDPTVPERNRRARNTVLLSAALLVAVAAVGVFLAFRFVAAERERDLAGWQVRLGIVADSRAAAVDEWLAQQFGVMRELAENASLQIYLTEMALAQGDATKVTDVEAQTAYLRNLVTAAIPMPRTTPFGWPRWRAPSPRKWRCRRPMWPPRALPRR